MMPPPPETFERTLGGRYRVHLERPPQLGVFSANDDRGQEVEVVVVRSDRATLEARLAPLAADPRLQRTLHVEPLEDGHWAVVREVASGHTLWGELERSPLPPARALGVIAEVADILTGLHARGAHHGNLGRHAVHVGHPAAATAPPEPGEVRLRGARLIEDWPERNDVEAVAELLEVMLLGDEGRSHPVTALPPSLQALLADAPGISARELAARCRETLAQLPIEQQIAALPQLPKPPVDRSPIMTNWSPPPDPPRFFYGNEERVHINHGAPPDLPSSSPRRWPWVVAALAVVALLAALVLWRMHAR